MQKNTFDKKVLLYSGGMDSWLIDKIWKPDLRLFIDIGTPSSKAERKRLPSNVEIIEFQSLGQFERKEDFILPLRNMYFLMIASNYGNEICLGATKTDINLDKTQEFAEKASDILSYMYQPQKWTIGRNIRVNLDFKPYTKGDLLKIYLANGGKWETAYRETFSCFTPINDTQECYNCRACFLKLMAFIDNGIKLPQEIIEPYLPYIREKVNSNDRLYSKEQYLQILEEYDIK